MRAARSLALFAASAAVFAGVYLVERSPPSAAQERNAPVPTPSPSLGSAAGQRLSEPGGLWVEPDGALLIADTGNDRLLRLPPEAAEAVVVPVGRRKSLPSVVVPTGPAAPSAAATANDEPPSRLAAEPLQLPARTLPLGAQRLNFALVAPPGFAFSEGAPFSLALTAMGGHLALVSSRLSGEASAGGRAEVGGDLEVAAGTGELGVAVHANLCDAIDHAACFPVLAHYALPVVGLAAADAAAEPVALALVRPAAAKAALGR